MASGVLCASSATHTHIRRAVQGGETGVRGRECAMAVHLCARTSKTAVVHCGVPPMHLDAGCGAAVDLNGPPAVRSRRSSGADGHGVPIGTSGRRGRHAGVAVVDLRGQRSKM